MVAKQINAMFSGEKINNTENRAVLHVALRSQRDDAPVMVDGVDVVSQVPRIRAAVRDECLLSVVILQVQDVKMNDHARVDQRARNEQLHTINQPWCDSFVPLVGISGKQSVAKKAALR